MPTVEIDELEFKQNKQLRDTVSKLLAHAEAGPLVEKALKMVDPNAATPRLDRQNQIQEPINAALKRVEELEAAMKKKDDEREKNEKLAAIQARVDAGKAQLRRDGWTEDGIKGVEKIMEERGLLDPLDAAAIFEKQHPPQTPVTPAGSGAWNFMEGTSGTGAEDFVKSMLESKGESVAALDKTINATLNDIRGPSRR